MISKGLQRFSTRLVQFRNDIEMADIIVINKEVIKGNNEKIFLKVSKDKHPQLSSRKNTKDSRTLVVHHLKKTLYVAFIKELYEEVTEYFKYILKQASENGAKPDRLVGEHKVKMTANEILSMSSKEEIVNSVLGQIFQQLENERSTINLIQSLQNKLGLKIDDAIIKEAIPYLKIRHIFVHADGKPDKEFRNLYPNIKLDSKKRIALTIPFHNDAYSKVYAMIKAFDKEMVKKKYISPNELFEVKN